MEGSTLWVIPTYNREAEAEALATVIESCDTHFASVIHTRPVKWSLSKAWNYGIYQALYRQSARIVLINDDVEIDRDFPQWLDEQIDANPGGLVCVDGFALVGTHPSTFVKVGKFDEAFYPAYYEDNDYVRRCQGVGVPELIMPRDGIGWVHKHNGTLDAMLKGEKAEFHATIRAGSQKHYIQKWGGLPYHETVPCDTYNGKDPFDVDFINSMRSRHGDERLF